tara:strand:+ start:2455 stop:3768 length:1314 start_codon:yes stop_codon:yes gene_type:complete
LDSQTLFINIFYFYVYNQEILIKFLIILLLLILSALISGSEVAFFSLTSADLKKAKQSKIRSLKLVYELRNTPKRLLASLLVSNNFLNIAIVIIFSSFGELFYVSKFPFWLNFTFEIIIITLFILIFGEIFPKIYANRSPVSFSKFMALPVNILDKYVLFFLTIPMSFITNLLQKKLVFKSATLSMDKISDALDLTDKTKTTKKEQKILKGIVSFGSIETKQVMKHRVDVFSISINTPFDQLKKQVKLMGYSRIPVYENKIDNVIGLIYLKDIFPHINKDIFEWRKLVREPYFVPENKKLDDLLKEFQKLKIHMAIVVNEFGGNTGIITMEDIVEEIVGDIKQDFLQENFSYRTLDACNFIFDGKTNLPDLYKALKIKDTKIFDNLKGESETIAGFILEQIGYFPKQGFVIKIENISMKVLETERKRIKKIKITIER